MASDAPYWRTHDTPQRSGYTHIVVRNSRGGQRMLCRPAAKIARRLGAPTATRVDPMCSDCLWAEVSIRKLARTTIPCKYCGHHIGQHID